MKGLPVGDSESVTKFSGGNATDWSITRGDISFTMAWAVVEQLLV